MDTANRDIIARDNLRLPTDFSMPAKGLETQIAQVFSEVLGVHPVGAIDEFYDLGGDSLMGEQISMMILERTGRAFPISGLFEAGTPRAIAAVLSGTAASGPAPVAAARETFFIVHGRRGYTVPRPEFMAGLSSGARVVMFELPGIRGDAPHPRSIPEVARAYVDKIEAELPQGPVRLASFCTGAMIALEMVHILTERGRPPETLVLLDPSILETHRKRHKAQLMLDENPASLLGRLGLLRAVGRLGPDSAFVEPLKLRARVLRNRLAFFLARMKQSKRAMRYRNVGLEDGPRAWLVAAYRHAWPAPVQMRGHIIASKARERELRATSGPWQRWLPDRIVHVMVDQHTDILSGTSAHVAAAMEALLLGRDPDQGIATQHTPKTDRASAGMSVSAVTAAP